MLLINKLTVPGGIKRVELKPTTVRVVLRDGSEKFYVERSDGDGVIADNMKDHWKHQRSGADR